MFNNVVHYEIQNRELVGFYSEMRTVNMISYCKMCGIANSKHICRSISCSINEVLGGIMLSQIKILAQQLPNRDFRCCDIFFLTLNMVYIYGISSKQLLGFGKSASNDAKININYFIENMFLVLIHPGNKFISYVELFLCECY